MDLTDFIDNIISLAKDNAVLAVILGLILLVLLFRKPKLFFGIVFLGLFLAVVFYLIMTMASSTGVQKKQLIEKGEKEIEDVR